MPGPPRADNDHVSGLDAALEYSLACFFLGIEDDGASAELEHVGGHASLLHNRPVLREIAPQDREPAVFRIGILQRANDLAVFHPLPGHIRPDALTGHGDAVAVDQAFDIA